MDLHTGDAENIDIDSLPGIFGLWRIGPEGDAAGLSYGLDAGEPEDTPIWRLTLPAQRQEADATLAELEALLRSSEEALEKIPERLDRMVQASRLAGSGGLSFDQGSLPALPEPEAELLASLLVLNQPFGGLSFEVPGESVEVRNGKLAEAFRAFEGSMERLIRQVTHFAWVETEVGEVMIARSIVSWNGDANTAWGHGLGGGLYQRHRRSLAQALASRNLLLHALVTTAQSAAKLGVLLATPGGALLALPLAWKFVNQVLADVEKIRGLNG
jgi:hypothetical protein